MGVEFLSNLLDATLRYSKHPADVGPTEEIVQNLYTVNYQ